MKSFIICSLFILSTSTLMVRADDLKIPTKANVGAQTVLIMNDQVRVVQTVLKPNQIIDFHGHDKGYVDISLESGDLVIETQSGESKAVHVLKDSAKWHDPKPKSDIHKVTNISKKTLMFVTVEILNKQNISQPVFPKDEKEKVMKDRILQFETSDLKVWQTLILPGKKLEMHRHDNKRVVVALTDLELKVTNDKGKSHLVQIKKGEAKYLVADKPGELHVDVNESKDPMSVMVVQFKNKEKQD